MKTEIPPIAIVDDDPMTRTLVRAWIEAEGLSAVEIASGAEAIERAAEFSLMCLDLHLDDAIGGKDVIERVAASVPDVTVLVMTGDSNLETAVDVEVAEVGQWLALLSYVPAAEHAIDSLERDLPKGEDAIEVPQIAELRKFFKAWKKTKKLSREQEKKYRSTCESMARSIRLADSDRLWIARAEESLKNAGQQAEDAEGGAGLDSQPPPAEERDSQIRLADNIRALAGSPAYTKALESVRQANVHSRIVKNEFVKANLRLVVSIARRYNRGRLPLIDLIQEGNIGLMKAVERFDPAHGAPFTSFAMPTVVGELRRHFRDRTWSLHVNRRAKELHLEVAGASVDVEHHGVLGALLEVVVRHGMKSTHRRGSELKISSFPCGRVDDLT